MIAAWMTYALMIGALLAVAALALEQVCRLAMRPTRWVWVGALSATIGLTMVAPYLSMVRGSSRAGLDALPSVTVAPVVGQKVAQAGGVLALLTDARRVVIAPLRHALVVIGHRAPTNASTSLALVWLALSALLLVMFATVYLRFRRARRVWPAAELQGFRVRIAPEAGPAVMGLVRPDIVVPRWLLARSADEQRLTLAHESEHVRARDPMLLAIGCVTAALLPWHPAVWWMLSRLRLSIELDCDARVLRQGAAPRSYGTLLIELAGRCAGLRMAATALADSSSHLERRLVAMKPQRHRFVRARSGVLAVFAGLAVIVACETPMPTSADVEKMDVASAEKSAVRANLIASLDSVTYFVNGQRVTAKQAHALAPDQIASIFVSKRAANQPDSMPVRGEIIITTKDAADTSHLRFVPRARAESLEVGRMRVAAAHKSVTLGSGMKTFAGLLVIDGTVSNSSALQSLLPDEIQSIEVIKGPAATKLYSDPKAANGVIRITTKAGATKK